MSRTLFWYVFRDLVRIFLMASGALAGIMSFGALLRPLTQNGLDGYQVLLLLRYFMPAMSTYSLPVAALFATTVVYGRMSADNEITACRASGISFLWMTVPSDAAWAFSWRLQFAVSCFVSRVPNASMKGEAGYLFQPGQVDRPPDRTDTPDRVRRFHGVCARCFRCQPSNADPSRRSGRRVARSA